VIEHAVAANDTNLLVISFYPVHDRTRLGRPPRCARGARQPLHHDDLRVGRQDRPPGARFV